MLYRLQHIELLYSKSINWPNNVLYNIIFPSVLDPLWDQVWHLVITLLKLLLIWETSSSFLCLSMTPTFLKNNPPFWKIECSSMFICPLHLVIRLKLHICGLHWNITQKKLSPSQGTVSLSLSLVVLILITLSGCCLASPLYRYSYFP